MSLKQRIPNYLTFSRIAVIPLMVAGFYLEGDAAFWVPAGLFLYAGITDFLDGWLARAWGAESPLGRFLDPIADKLLVAAALVWLVADHRAPALAAMVILLRELLVSGLREHLMELRVPMPVSKLAKYKTATQMIAIFLLLLGDIAPELGTGLLWLAALLTAITGWDYLRTGLRHLTHT